MSDDPRELPLPLVVESSDKMDILEVIKELRQELERIDGLILALDSMQSGRRRGRPPKLLQQLRAGSRAAAPGKRKAAKKGKKKASARAAQEPAGKKQP